MNRKLLVLSLTLMLIFAAAVTASAQKKQLDFVVITHSATIDF